jgi:hypothetical protein
VFAAQGGGLGQSVAPDFEGLAGDGEHQVEVQIIKARLAEKVERVAGHAASVNAPEAVEQSFIERLHSQGDAVDAGGAEQFRLFEGDGGRVAFHGPLGHPGQGEPLQGAEDSLPLAEVKERGGAAAEEDRARLQAGTDPLQFTAERAHVTVDQLPAGRLGVEGAVEALAHAEGHVDIETRNRLGGGLDHSRK